MHQGRQARHDADRRARPNQLRFDVCSQWRQQLVALRQLDCGADHDVVPPSPGSHHFGRWLVVGDHYLVLVQVPPRSQFVQLVGRSVWHPGPVGLAHLALGRWRSLVVVVRFVDVVQHHAGSPDLVGRQPQRSPDHHRRCFLFVDHDADHDFVLVQPVERSLVQLAPQRWQRLGFRFDDALGSLQQARRGPDCRSGLRLQAAQRPRSGQPPPSLVVGFALGLDPVGTPRLAFALGIVDA